MSPSPPMAMLLLAVTMLPCALVASVSGSGLAAHPAYSDDGTGTCGPVAGTRLEEYDGGRIMDITHAYRPELPAAGPDGLGRVVHLIMSMANGTLFNLSELRMDGPALLVDVPRNTNITEDGAQWLVDNTDIKLVGVDYLSVAAFDYLISAHVVFFKKTEDLHAKFHLISKKNMFLTDIIPVEGLKLDDVEAGAYMLHCLPLRLIGAEGSPVRCILIK
ncbi:hypothetical protein PR202_ga06722 [Eleusine coracana subsp. coracana]|uniref:Uncharacterized protein n=1 Tax=Eleusine coracana subsp. coracana TaxID=191504 RepID=A0AAV5BWW2_ELECO|nr:hypothetical protein PR202_ga06722 [Eleusine coracana subsp. coracana]